METIALGKLFYVDGTEYTCVGHDSGFIWGCSDEYSESKPFDYDKYITRSEFTISTPNCLNPLPCASV